MPNNEPNWIDRLWANPDDGEAEENLRRLWLESQADRKPAWDRLCLMVETSEKLPEAARAQIKVVLGNIPEQELKPLTSNALKEAQKILKAKRWELPASTRGVFVPYLGSRHPKTNRYHWVANVLREHFKHAAHAGEREKALEGDNQ